MSTIITSAWVFCWSMLYQGALVGAARWTDAADDDDDDDDDDQENRMEWDRLE